mgnify:FL=1
MSLFEDLKVFSGNAHTSLAADICSHLGITLGKCEVFKFTNDQTFVRIQENIREKDVFLVQPISKPVNDNLMELLIMIDAARRASAGRITAVIPYYAYGRTDKKDQPRVAITARLIADFLTAAGADRILTMNLHAGQIQGFFNIPVDELDAIPLLSRTYIEKNIKDLVVVATDVGSAKRARDMGDMLNAPIAIIEKDRLGNQDRVEAISIIGEVDGKTALIVDDEVDTGGSVIAGAKILAESGANKIYCCVVHPLLSGEASKNLLTSNITSLLATDTLPINSDKMIDKIEIISVAPILGEAIHRIHSGLSVGAMFESFK